mgnify:CR=1 FL=1
MHRRDEQSELAVIKGHIASTVKQQDQPFKLIVNGVPMPLHHPGELVLAHTFVYP